MDLVYIIGNVGSGKNLLMVMIALQNQQKPFKSNFFIKHQHYEPLELTDFLELPFGYDIYIDEAYRWLESRRSMSSINIDIAGEKEQRRKFNANWYLSSQWKDLLDKRFSERPDILIQCKKRVPNSHDDFHYTITFKDYEYNEYRDSMVVMDTYKKTFKLSYENAQKYFEFYNTRETISTENKAKKEWDLIKHDAEKIFAKVLELAPLIEKDYQEGVISDYTQKQIKFSCLKNKIYYRYADYLWMYLSEKIKIE